MRLDYARPKMNAQNRSTTTVMLLRHAHAAWARPGQRDFDRPLDRRGRDDAKLIGTTMAAEGLLPQIVLCSPARRCVETLDIIDAVLPDDLAVKYFDDIYTRSHNRYIELLSEQSASTLLLCGHNPMMEDTARALTETAESWAAHRLDKGFPTAGLAIVEAPYPPAELQRRGYLRRFLTPKRLRKLEQDEL